MGGSVEITRPLRHLPPRARPLLPLLQVQAQEYRDWVYSFSYRQSFPTERTNPPFTISNIHRDIISGIQSLVSLSGYLYYILLTLSYRALSFSAIASYFDLSSGSTSDHLLPSSLAMSPTPNSGFFSLTLPRSSLQNQKNADLFYTR